MAKLLSKLKMKNNYRHVILVRLLLRKDEISCQEEGGGRYYKRDVTKSLSSVLSYSATVHLGRPAHLVDGLSSL